MPVKTIKVTLWKSMHETQQRSMNCATQVRTGLDAYGTTTINLGTINSTTVTVAGWGYTNPPNCLVTGDGDYGTVRATMNAITNTNALAGSVSSFVVIADGAGVGYIGAPGITCMGGRGSLLPFMIEVGD